MADSALTDGTAARFDGDLTTETGGSATSEPTRPDYWSPGSRLVSRSATKPTVRRSTARSSGLLLAAAIVLLAALIALGLWSVAVWARGNDQVDDSEATAVSPITAVDASTIDASVGNGAFT